ncbi:ATP-binding protein [Actinomadura sp. 7K507]|uniref:ATP-binding protein n=1 Tax=Actinomadura sp. 7K507 TaxID=2530365 RepID=UPI001053B715|nr:ATP-binding protein [Actinomadura sp. 7K507]TDC74673.1 ATP-binding protein [Actinomadura sp. 7K507]
MNPVTVNERRAFTSSYLATPASVGIARNAAKLAALGWGFTYEKAEEVCLVVSELFTNSIRAAMHTEIRVTIAENVPGHVTVEVWDESPDQPERKFASLTDPGGRGLWIVEELAVHCGVRRENDGKVVYAVL